MDGGDVLEAAGECRALLGAAVDRDWTKPIPELDWTVAQGVIHIAEGTRAPAGADSWPALLWANGRVALPGHPRQARWRWHCAPLEEWDGVNPADRR